MFVRTLLAVLLLMPFAHAEEPWVELLKKDTTTWKEVDAKWIYAPDAELDPLKPKMLKAKTGEGTNVWINGEKGNVKDLRTKKDYVDCEVSVEFMVGTASNSGIKFHALYEIQIKDSFGKTGKLTGDECGGIYPRAEYKPKYHHIDDGVPPKVNASKKPGEWQLLEATFRAARFDDKGEKKENAKLVIAKLNGQIIHENQELKTPTGANYVVKEKIKGPFMLQADHGPVAFRNVKIREVK